MEATRYSGTRRGQGKWWVRQGHTAMASPEAKVLIGQRIRAARESQGLKSVDVAKLVGRHPSAISDIERGSGAFSLGFLLQVAETLEVEPASLLPSTPEGEYAKGIRHGFLEAINLLQENIPEG